MTPAWLSKLQEAYPWPEQRPDVKPVDWGLDAGGKHLVIDQIKHKRLELVLEIGVFLGASAKVWLNTSPEVVVIAMDPWKGGPGLQTMVGQFDQPAWVAEQLCAHEDAMYQTFLRNLWEYRDRVIPVRARAPEALYDLHRLGVQPDLVFLDADKSGRELEVCRQLFPEAILTGDDWFYGTDRFWNPDSGYPIRKPVKEFCRRHDCHLVVDRMTWVITKDAPPSRYFLTRCRYQLKSARRRVRGAFRWMTGRDRAA